MNYIRYIETAAPKGNRFVRFKEYLLSNGFKVLSDTEDNSTRRYVKKGFYDGDYPNAHQTKVKTITAKFEIPDPDGRFMNVALKFIKDEKIKVSKPWRRQNTSTKKMTTSYHTEVKSGFYSRIDRIEYVKPVTRVFVEYETTTPDLEFDRSGLGIGQII